MFAEQWLESLTPVTGYNTVNTAILFSLLFTFIVTIFIVAVTNIRKGNVILEMIVVTDFTLTLLFLFMGWYPQFTGAVIALLFALIGVYLVLGER